MEPSPIDKILEAKKQAEAGKPAPAVEPETDKFFSTLTGEGLVEHFLELQFRDGTRSCFSYDELLWFSYDPEVSCIDLEIGGFLITINGRGLAGKLFHGIKSKRVGWLKESDSDMQDHKDNETFIEKITITPPKGFADEELSQPE